MWTSAETLERIELGSDAFGLFGDRPLVAVELRGDSEDATLAAVAATVPCVFVGIATSDDPIPATPELDVMLSAAADPPRPWVGCGGDPEAVLALLGTSVQRSPRAAIVLAETLRLTSAAPVAEGLVIESLAYGLLQSGPEHAAWLAQRGDWIRPPLPGAPVLTARTDAELTITLNRPRLQNAYDYAMRDALCEALALAVADDSIGRVVLEGAGRSFCIGGDLREFGTRPDAVTAHLVRRTRSAAPYLAACASKLTAKVHGNCLGSGIEIAAFASRVTATPDTVIRLPELALGLIPGAGGTVSVTARAGRARTAYLALSGAPLDASAALGWGVVDVIES